MRNEFKGPFLGFTFNGVHSSELGIVRINTGSRAETLLSPSFKDTSSDIPGGDGLYYFNTQIQQLNFTVNFGYDDLSEDDVRKIKEVLNPKYTGTFFFDETPFMVYTVKVSSQPKLSYLVFGTDKEDNGRVYKGEGAIAFTAFKPYGAAPYKTLQDYKDNLGLSDYEVDEWAAASRIQDANFFATGLYDLDLNSLDGPNTTRLYNAGNIDTPLDFEFEILSRTPDVKNYVILKYTWNNILDKYMYLDITNFEEGMIYMVRSSICAIMDGDENIRNEALVAGDFLQIRNYGNGEGHTLSLECKNCDVMIMGLDYKYMYL